MREAGGITPGKEATFCAKTVVSKQSSLPGTAERVPPEETEAQADSFVVRIWRQAGQASHECRGWVEHVQSGKRTFFLGLSELSSIIASHIGMPVRRGGCWRERLARWRERVAGCFGQGER